MIKHSTGYKSLFQRAISLDALRAALAVSFHKGKATGGDGETLEQFAAGGEPRLLRLHEELASGLYQPGPLRRFAIPKSRGPGERVLSIPAIVDRIVQRAVATVLSERLEPEFEEHSYAYRSGRSVQQAVARVAALRNAGYTFVVDADIRAYFDEVPHKILLSKLRALNLETEFVSLIESVLQSFSTNGIGLAQGSPISPVLANLYLDALDELFEKSPVRIVRFADDFVLLTKTKPGAEEAMGRARTLLAEHGLILHAEKTRIVEFDQAFTFLGHLFVRSVVLKQEKEEQKPPQLGHRSLSMGRFKSDVDPFEEQASEILLNGPPEELPPPDEVERIESPVGGNTVLFRKRKRQPDPEDPYDDLIGDRAPEDFALGLAPLYVLEKGGRLGIEHQTFVVTNENQTLLKVPARMVGRIDLGPETEADDRALRLAGAYQIPVAFLNGSMAPDFNFISGFGPTSQIASGTSKTHAER